MNDNVIVKIDDGSKYDEASVSRSSSHSSFPGCFFCAIFFSFLNRPRYRTHRGLEKKSGAR